MKEICKKCGSVLLEGSKDVKLNTKITPVLFIEGILNEVRKKVQSMRKEAGYKLNDKIILCSDSTEILNFDYIKSDVQASVTMSGIHKGCDVYDEIHGIKLGIKKI
jgi:hypothetical protein